MLFVGMFVSKNKTMSVEASFAFTEEELDLEKQNLENIEVDLAGVSREASTLWGERNVDLVGTFSDPFAVLEGLDPQAAAEFNPAERLGVNLSQQFEESFKLPVSNFRANRLASAKSMACLVRVGEKGGRTTQARGATRRARRPTA